MTKTPENLEALLGHWVDFLLSTSFLLCKISMPHHTVAGTRLSGETETTYRQIIIFQRLEDKALPSRECTTGKEWSPPCHALPQEADCFLMVPFGILEEFFISFFTFSSGFLLFSAKHRQTNSCSRTKANLIPTQWDLRVGLGSLLICAKIRTFVHSPHPPHYRRSDKLHQSHRLTHFCFAFGEHFRAFWCLLLLQEISMDFAISQKVLEANSTADTCSYSDPISLISYEKTPCICTFFHFH